MMYSIGLGQSVMDEYATMEKKLMYPYAPIPALGEIVETAANDPFWQEYGLPSLEGMMGGHSKIFGCALIGGLAALGYYFYKKRK